MEKVIEERNIRHLVHFTRVENLKSIIERGLLPRSYLESNNISCSLNDEERLDAHLDSVSCSISFPNYKMFYRLRKRNPDVSWAILLLDTSILKEKRCAFFHTNAARGDSRKVDILNIAGKDALESLFNENEDWFKIAFPVIYERYKSFNNILIKKESIRDSDIPNNYTTDPQAEVLVFDVIEPENIKYVLFNEGEYADEYSKLYPHIDFLPVKKEFFSPRIDFVNWKKDRYGF